MFISDFAIRRPIITIVTMIALVVFGLASLFRLETDEFPELDQPIVFIGVIGGVGASTVLNLVVIPTVYEIMEEWRSRLLRRFGLRALGAPGLVPASADAHVDD